MKLKILSPTKAYIIEASTEEMESLTNQLSYKNLSAQHQLKRLSKNHFFRNSNPLKYKLQYDLLKSQIDQCLVFNDPGSSLQYIRPGSSSYLENLPIQIESDIVYPKPKKLGWFRPISYKPYYYQEESVKSLIKAKHANVSMTTGSGKSIIILMLCQQLGLKTAVVAPSRGIFKELVEKFEYHFGKGKIGKFGDGRKSIGKNITICIGDSLCNIEKDTPEWEFFSTMECIIVDESHTFAAETLEEVAHRLFETVPYRFFLSATQTRGDGGLKLLQSIIGPTVYSLTTKEAVDGGFILPHDYKIVRIENPNPNLSDVDPLNIKRELFLRNKNISLFTAKLCNVLASRNEQTLVLVEELGQISSLVKNLNCSFGYAHSESNKERLAALGLEKVSVEDQIEKFNRNEIKVLIGTSCIHVGVNIYPATNVVNWIGGSSEIKTRQAAIGRAIRLSSANPHKSLCGDKNKVTIWDFDILDNYVLERQLQSRISCYMDSGDNLIKYIKL